MKSSNVGAIYLEKMVSQEEGEESWSGVGETSVNLALDKISDVVLFSENTFLCDEDVDLNNQTVVLCDGNNAEVVKINADDTTDTTQTLDVFNDGFCIATYPLDGNATDLSGNYNGTWSGTEQYDTGKYGQAAKFDGSSYIDIGHVISNIETGDYSISVWLKSNNSASNSDYTSIFVLDNGVDNNLSDQISVFQTSASNEIRIINEGTHNGGNTALSYTVPDIMSWNNVVLSANNGVLTIYINGVKKDTVSIYSGTENGQSISIGGSVCTVWDNFHGLIDQVRIFNRALSDDEVQKLYYEGKKYVNPSQIVTQPTSVYEYKQLTLAIEGKTCTTSNTPSCTVAVIEEGDGYVVVPNVYYTDEIQGLNLIDTTDTTQTLDVFGDGSCIAAYPLDGNANDLSGNYNGTWSGTEQYDTGKYGQAASFDGSSYIKMGDWLTTVSSSGVLSFAYWVNTTSTADQTLWCTNNLLQPNTVLISINNLQYWDINETKYEYGLSISDGVYHFIVAIIDTNNSIMRYYLDGEKVYETTFASGSSILNSSDMSLGRRYDSTYYTNGNVDQVRIFNRALTENEVQQLYSEQGRKYDTSGLLVNPKSLVFKPTEKMEIISVSTSNVTGYANINDIPTKVYADKQELIINVSESTQELIDTIKTLDVFDDGSCIAAYPFDGNANDLSGNYNGTWSGTEAYDTGKFEQAASFDGSNYVDIGHVNLGVTIGLSAWINRGYSADYDVIAGFSNNDLLIGFEANGHRTIVWSYNNGGYSLSTSAQITLLNKWYHIFYLYDNGAVKIYIDGVLTVNSTIEVAQTGNSDGNSIGTGLFQQDGKNFHGLIDQVRIFNRALTDDEVQKLYCEGKKYVNLKYGTILSATPSSIEIPIEKDYKNIKNQMSYNAGYFNVKFDGMILSDGTRSIQREVLIDDKNVEVLPPLVTPVYKA